EELGDFADFSVRSAMVAYLARPGEAQNVEAARTTLEGMVTETGADNSRNRVEAARLLCILPDSFDPLLSMLFADQDKTVVRHAIRSVGMLLKCRLVLELLDCLAIAELSA